MSDFNHRIQIVPEYLADFLATLPPLLTEGDHHFAFHANENGPIVYVVTDRELTWPSHWVVKD